MTSEAKIITGIGIATVLIIVIGLFFAAGKPSDIPEVKVQANLLSRVDSPKITSANAKVQVVEFGDFECPACAAFAPVMRQLLADYGDKLDFVFRIIPIHQHSREAAAAALAANEQGKFKEMYEKLYENQDTWSTPNADRTKLFRQYAGEIGLDLGKYDATIAKNTLAYNALIDRDSKDAETMNIMVTPTIIVGGTTVFKGAAPYATMKQAIDQALASGQPIPADSPALSATDTATTTN